MNFLTMLNVAQWVMCAYSIHISQTDDKWMASVSTTTINVS